MKRALFTIVFAAFLAAFAACGSGKTTAPAEPEKTAAVEAPAQPAEQAQAPAEAAPATAGEQEAPAEATAEGTGEANAENEPESAEDPDDEAWGGTGVKVDREKLAKAYEEVYCAQKKNEMEKILDIYKNYGFEKPEDFISMWMDAAKDTDWVTKIAHDATSKCK